MKAIERFHELYLDKSEMKAKWKKTKVYEDFERFSLFLLAILALATIFIFGFFINYFLLELHARILLVKFHRKQPEGLREDVV